MKKKKIFILILVAIVIISGSGVLKSLTQEVWCRLLNTMPSYLPAAYGAAGWSRDSRSVYVIDYIWPSRRFVEYQYGFSLTSIPLFSFLFGQGRIQEWVAEDRPKIFKLYAFEVADKNGNWKLICTWREVRKDGFSLPDSINTSIMSKTLGGMGYTVGLDSNLEIIHIYNKDKNEISNIVLPRDFYPNNDPPLIFLADDNQRILFDVVKKNDDNYYVCVSNFDGTNLKLFPSPDKKLGK